MSKRTDEPKEVLNISAGNQPITEDPKPLKPEDRRTGDFKQDFWSAFRVRLRRILFERHKIDHSAAFHALFLFCGEQRIRPIDDLQSKPIETIPPA
jgi:hypothetical protein